MVKFLQIIFSILAPFFSYDNVDNLLPHTQTPKSIAIIGAGSAGLAMLKTILDLPEHDRSNLDFTVFEQRHDVGGIWLPDPKGASPPNLPETPLYPLLHTNTPTPSMTYPGFPFPPGTPLYASHEHVLAYHRRFVSHFNLRPHIRFNHEVIETHWQGSSDSGVWNVTLKVNGNTARHEMFDHLIIATGNNHYPHAPVWPGQDDWLAHSPPTRPVREMMHSIYYRTPEKYTNKSVLVIGSMGSGQDVAAQALTVAKKVYVSVRHESTTAEGAIVKPEISHFSSEGVFFVDGTFCEIDAVVVATGYEMRKPFMDRGHAMITNASAHSNSSVTQGLVTNLRYIFPLHKHILSLCPSHPPHTLSFIGLPSAIANCPSDVAESLFALHAILNPSILPDRTKMLEGLAASEESLRNRGFDPYVLGHELPPGSSSDYQDELIDFLQRKNAIPKTDRKFVDGWRRDVLEYDYLKRGWKRIEKLGVADDWLEGVETESQWADLMRRVNEWQKEWESRNDVPFTQDPHLVGWREDITIQ